MSIEARIKKQEKSGLFGIVAGERLSGKSTLAGTAKGKTLLLQAALLETASQSAEQLARSLGNHVDTIDFTSVDDLRSILMEAEKTDYNTIYIDGLSAISDMINNSREIQTMMKKDNWSAFREIGAQLSEVQLMCKQFSIQTGKDVFMTLALKPKMSPEGTVVALDPVIKGNVAIEQMKKLCPVVISLRTFQDESGKLRREMLTKTSGVYPARIDMVLDHNNPGRFDADNIENPDQTGLAGLVNFLKGL